MPTNDVSTPSRTHLRVVRSDGREFPSFFVAYRELLGTAGELGYSEHQRMRAVVRSGETVQDRHGFTWRSVGGTVSEQTIRWTDFTFGIELELLAPFAMHDMQRKLQRLEAAAGFSVKHDGSLQGAPGFTCMEIVSPVLQGEAGIARVKTVMDWLKAEGCKINSSCGLHVHVGVRGMRADRLRRISIAFFNAEQHFDALMPASRRNNRYAQSNRAVAQRVPRELENAASISDLGRLMNGGNSRDHYNQYRYYKLNFQSFVRHGTIEFRQHGGSVESEKAVAWVKLITGFCAAAAANQQQAVDAPITFEQFLTAAAPDVETHRFMTARRAKFETTARAVAA